MTGTGLIDLLTWSHCCALVHLDVLGWSYQVYPTGHITILPRCISLVVLSHPGVPGWSYHPTQVYLAARDGLLGQLRLQMETLANRVGTDKR